MAERTNRKRIRHRPHRGQRRYITTANFTPSAPTSTMPPSQPSLFQSPPQRPMQVYDSSSFSPSAMSIRYSYSSPLSHHNSTDGSNRIFPTGGVQPNNTAPSPPARGCNTTVSEKEENAFARDLRVFGGEAGDGVDSATDLRGPMLDVVLGLFNGVDYDDDDAF